MKNLDEMALVREIEAHGKIVEHIPMDNERREIVFTLGKASSKEFYVFESILEYKSYLLMHSAILEAGMVEESIYGIASNGRVFVYKGICDFFMLDGLVSKMCRKYDSPKKAEREMLASKDIRVEDNLVFIPPENKEIGSYYVLVDIYSRTKSAERKRTHN